MRSFDGRELGQYGGGRIRIRRVAGPALAVAAFAAAMAGLTLYNGSRIDVETGQQAILIRKVGLDLEPGMELAPPPKGGSAWYKGVQAEGVLTEGRYFYNPLVWSWEYSKQFEVPNGKVGVRVALAGDDLPAGQILAEPGQKGILRGVRMPGRYPYNTYAETIELHDLVTVPAGFRGVVTLLAGREPKDPNVFLVGAGERGVQPETLTPGTYPLNPYETRVSQVDCRSQRFNLGKDVRMDFLSADGFPVTLDGAVEFRVVPERVAEVFVKYNEMDNGDDIDEEIISKIITPESRSICRIGGSKLAGGQFLSGDARELFQRDLVRVLTENCKKQGIEILAVAITSITPPDAIAAPVRDREVAKQELSQFTQEKLQQVSEAQLKVQEILADQKRKLVEADQAVNQQVTKAEEHNQVAVTLAEQKRKVAGTQLEAAKDKAAAVMAKAEADAEVIRFNNTADLAGLASRVRAFGGDGSALAQNALIAKVAPAFRSIMTSSDGPLMELFGQFTARPRAAAAPPSSAFAPAGDVAAPVRPGSITSNAESKP